MLLLSLLIPVEDIPEDVKIYPSIIACRIKEKGLGLWKFETRHCLHGGSMEQGKDFDFSCSPTGSHPAVRAQLSKSAIRSHRIYGVDVSNCFQNDVIKPEDRLYVHAPPCYKEWQQLVFPEIKVKPSKSGKHALQTINGVQGRKDAGRSWYLLLVRIFEAFGLLPCPAEPALFSYFDGPDELTIITSTDDFLISSSSISLFKRLCTHIEEYVPITIQEGPVIKYLNIRIIQTELGISIDQTHHIQTSVLDTWFPATKTERLKSADTPYRTDSQYERDLQEQLPATGTQLAKLEKEHGGKFNALIGQFLHIEQVTRFEIGFAVTRLAQFNAAPNAASFAGLKRIARFLATHPHAPIFYPVLKLTMHQTIRFEIEPGKYIEQLISNLREMYVDADHARDLKTRKSITRVLSAVCGVLIHWHMGKQTCVTAHSTDAEIRVYYTAEQINKYLRMVDEYM